MAHKKYLVVAKNAPNEAKQNLIKLGYNIIESTALKSVHPALKYHPDMQLVNADECWICAPECYEYYKPHFKLLDIKLIKGEKSPGQKYPDDVCYNVANVGNYAVHNFNYTDSMFLSCCTKQKINVGQGYTKCSVCVAGDNAVITADQGIAKQLKKFDIDVLLVCPGNIDLPPFDYGFIGGASGLLENDKLAFCGNIATNPQYNEIKEFCFKHNVEIVNLTMEKPCDIGTIIRLG